MAAALAADGIHQEVAALAVAEVSAALAAGHLAAVVERAGGRP